MKFVFTDKKVNLPNKVHAYAEKKVGKLDRYFKADAEAAIVFSVEKDLLCLPQQRGRQPVHRLSAEKRRLRPDRGRYLTEENGGPAARGRRF